MLHYLVQGLATMSGLDLEEPSPIGLITLLSDTMGTFLCTYELLWNLVFQKMKSNLVFVLEFLRLLAKRELLEYNV